MLNSFSESHRTSKFNQYLDRWFIEVPYVGSCLSWFLAQHHGLRVNETKGINYDLPFNTLNWIYHHSYGPLI